MFGPAKLPMALVARAERALETKDGALEAIASAYWTPDSGWEFWEYLGDSMEVLENMPAPTDDVEKGASRWHYQVDFQRARKLWPALL
jgi:hypothetical protein